MTEHLQAFQAIADDNGGNRAAGLPGYDASVDYVVETLEAAGWNVTLDTFDFTYVGPAELEQTSPMAPPPPPTRRAPSPAPAMGRSRAP